MADDDDVSRRERCIKTQAIIENLKHKIAQCLKETAQVEAEIEGQKNLTDKQSWEAWKEYEWVQAQYERYTETKKQVTESHKRQQEQLNKRYAPFLERFHKTFECKGVRFKGELGWLPVKTPRRENGT